MTTTVACTNINLLEEAQMPASPSNTELYAVEIPIIDYVIESKIPTSSDPTWYRVYKSGWVEQGGICYSNTAVTFAKQMADTNYSVIVSLIERVNGGGGAKDITATGFTPTIQQYNAGDWITSQTTKTCWEVKGQGAST